MVENVSPFSGFRANYLGMVEKVAHTDFRTRKPSNQRPSGKLYLRTTMKNNCRSTIIITWYHCPQIRFAVGGRNKIWAVQL
jgi:hypothetical protein